MSTKELEIVSHKTEEIPPHYIILYNDDVNTFEHVIASLVQCCDHTPEQAEQCSLIVHFKGKCTVKTGELEDLIPRCTSLQQRGLSAEIAS